MEHNMWHYGHVMEIQHSVNRQHRDYKKKIEGLSYQMSGRGEKKHI
jgi:hypothetical protein